MSFIPMRVSVGTVSSVSGTAGTGAAGRVTYWQDATTLTSSSSFTFDGTSLGVPDGAAATPAYTFASATNTGFFLASATRVDLSLGGSSICDFQLYKMGVTATGGNPARVTATAANTAGSAAFTEMTVLGGSGGDAYSKYSIFGAIDWFAGVDNDDNDKYKIGNGGLGVGNDFLTITSTGLVSFINNVTVTSSGGPHITAVDGGTIGTNADPFFQLNDTNGLVGAWGFLTANSKNMSLANYTNTGSVYISANGAAGIEVSSAQLVTIGSAGGTQIHRINGDTGTAGAVSTYLKLNVNGTEYRVPLHATA